MVAKYILDKKREGRALGTAEIREFIEGFVRGEVPDYQASAFAMAVCCRGMTTRETADLTEAMMKSGACLDWPGMATADKHSTGGVGDKLSLVIQPLAAACGVYVPSLTGRGLGLTGGTADKLETIPGYDAGLSMEAFRKVLAEVGVSMTVQTAEIAPADKKMYALRDVTGTVASIPLITASILSKKLAEGAGSLVFDVKCGCGAFMKTVEEAKELAASLVAGAKAAGRKASAFVTRMDDPLGYTVGNANEVAEAIATLKDPEKPACGADVLELCVTLAAEMVALALGMEVEAATAMCRERLADGSAYAKFEAMVKAQGGDLDRFARFCGQPTFKFKIQSMRSGYVTGIDAEKVARVSLALGAGREKTTDRIDPRAGVTLAVRRGDKVSVGAPLATLEASFSPDGLERAAADLYKAFEIGSVKPDPESLVIEKLVTSD